MKKIVRYQANDGKEFATVEECRAHDKATKQRPKLFAVSVTLFNTTNEQGDTLLKAVCLTEECAYRVKDEELIRAQRAYHGSDTEVSARIEPVTFIKDKK